MYPPISNDNTIKNTKYNLLTFLPVFFFNQFKYFFNFYYLCLCLSQFVTELKIGFLFTYIGPLAFVLFLSLFNEIVDEVTKYLRDFEVNNEKYEIVEHGLLVDCRAGNLQVGDVVLLPEGKRAPADLVILGSK
jgi:phospholipid-translocating ATPase